MSTQRENERAKELYLINFANHMTMKKNGEFEEYCKFKISEETEHKWSCEVKEALIDEISSGQNLLQVVQLAHINLSESEILDAFKLLASVTLRDEILATVKRLKPLFEPDLYKKIEQLFN